MQADIYTTKFELEFVESKIYENNVFLCHLRPGRLCRRSEP